MPPRLFCPGSGRVARVTRAPVALPPLGLGCAALGNLYSAVSDAQAEATLAAARAEGIGYFDTAPHYGQGLSEQRLGAFLGREPEPRPILSSKLGRSLVPAEAVEERDGFRSRQPFRALFDYSAAAAAEQLAGIVGRLGREPDILLVHDIGRLVHGRRHEERLREALAGVFPFLLDWRARAEGRAIGIGVNEIAVCLEVLEAVPIDVILLAGRYTLLEQEALDRLFPVALERGVAIVLGGPFNSGVLAGGAHYNYGAVPRAVQERVAALAAVAGRHGLPLPAAALQFPLAHPAVASVIPGCRSAAEVRACAAWSRFPIPEAFWMALRADGLVRADAPLPGGVA
ncbi:aldo/keto reductase [Thermaurantiacus sp.]